MFIQSILIKRLSVKAGMGNGMRGMMETQGIRVGMRGMEVGICWECRESGCECRE